MKRLTYDLSFGDSVPKPGDFIVSIISKGVGSIYHIVTVRKVNSKTFRFRYALEVLIAEDMRLTTIIKDKQPYVRGRKAFPLYWYSRNHKSEGAKL